MQVMKVPPGMDVYRAKREACRMAIVEQTDVSFVHNDKPFTITLEKARSPDTKEMFKRNIDSLLLQERSVVDQATRLRAEIEKERRFAEEHLDLTIAKKRFKNPRTPRTKK